MVVADDGDADADPDAVAVTWFVVWLAQHVCEEIKRNFKPNVLNTN